MSVLNVVFVYSSQNIMREYICWGEIDIGGFGVHVYILPKQDLDKKSMILSIVPNY